MNNLYNYYGICLKAQAHFSSVMSYPNVDFRANVALSFEHFRCGVRWTSAPRGQVSVASEKVAKPEVGDLDVATRVDQEVLGLKV